MSDDIPIEEQANVPGGLMSFDPGTIPGKRPPNFGSREYHRLPPLTEVYGQSPAMQALPLLKEWNDLPDEERAKASATFVRARLSNPDDEWWP